MIRRHSKALEPNYAPPQIYRSLLAVAAAPGARGRRLGADGVRFAMAWPPLAQPPGRRAPQTTAEAPMGPKRRNQSGQGLTFYWQCYVLAQALR